MDDKLNSKAHTLYEAGNLKEALVAFSQLCDQRLAVLGPDNPSTLSTKHNIVRILHRQGKIEEAHRLCDEVYEKRRESLGDDHPSTFVSQNRMAAIMESEGNLEDAWDLLYYVYNKRIEILGEEHRETLATLTYMAPLLFKQNRLSESLNIYKKILANRITEPEYGPSHPDTLSIQNKIGLILHSQLEAAFKWDSSTSDSSLNIDLDSALKAHQEIILEQIHLLGSGHPDVLETQGNILSLQEEMKVLPNDALTKEWAQLYEKYVQTFGSDDIKTVAVKCHIASLLKTEGKNCEALKSYEDMYTIILTFQRKHSVMDAAAVLAAEIENEIAQIFWKQGKFDEALKFFTIVYRKDSAIRGDHHQDTLRSKSNMAAVLKDKGELGEALSLYKEILRTRTLHVGDDNTEIIATAENIALILEELGKLQDAFTLYETVFKKKSRTLGQNHPSTLKTKRSMATILVKQCEFSRALEYLEEVYEETLVKSELLDDIARTLVHLHRLEEAMEVYERIEEDLIRKWGREHTRTLTTQSQMAFILYQLDRHGDALRMYEQVFECCSSNLGPHHSDTLEAQRQMIHITFNQVGCRQVKNPFTT